MPLRPCLCLMFNHALPEQLPLFREIYGDRFSRLRFLQPLQRSAEADVITVYRGSYAFPAYLTDACARLMDVDCTHFLFMHDDVLLSPALNETNLCEVLEVSSEAEGFTPSLAPVDSDIGWWWWPGVLWRLLHPRNILSGTGLNSFEAALAALPPQEVARERMRRYGIDHGMRLTHTKRSVERWGNPAHFGVRDSADQESFNRILLEGLFSGTGPGDAIELPYPIAMTGAYSDFSLIPKASLPEVAHIVGVLSAAGLFAELALGTAMALAMEKVRLADEIGLEFEWLLHDKIDPDVVLARMAEFPSLVASHPLKMSRVVDHAGLVRRLQSPGAIDIASRSRHGTMSALAPDFDPKAYAQANPDVPERFARHHYKLHGHAEGRPLRP